MIHLADTMTRRRRQLCPTPAKPDNVWTLAHISPKRRPRVYAAHGKPAVTIAVEDVGRLRMGGMPVTVCSDCLVALSRMVGRRVGP